MADILTLSRENGKQIEVESNFTQEEIQARELQQEQDKIQEAINKYNDLKVLIPQTANKFESVFEYGEHLQRFEEKDIILMNEVIYMFDSNALVDNQDAWYDKTMDEPNIKWKFPLTESFEVITGSTVLKQLKMLGMARIQALVLIEEVVYTQLEAIKDDLEAMKEFETNLEQTFEGLLTNV